MDAFSHRKMIGVRRLDINPSAHKFDLQFMIIDDVISPKFNNNSWEIVKAEIIHTKQLIWEEGIHEFGPIFTMSNDVITVKKGFDELDVFKRMYMIRYECKRVENGYYINISTKESDAAINVKMFRINNKKYTILEENEIAEIIHKIVDEANVIPDIDIRFQYNSKKCNLKIESDVLFNLFPVYHNDKPIGTDVSYFDTGLIEFLKFLNQPITLKNYFDMLIFKKEFNYNNVWSRRQAYIHSTFSDSRRGYIGLRNDFWTKPSKLYVYSNGGQEFYIRFATNGINSFLPIHSGFIIELVFITDIENVSTIN